MDSKEHLVASCDASSTKTVEIQWVPNVPIPKIKKEKVESSDEEELPLSVYKHRYEPLESTEYINHYDCKDYVLRQVKKEFPEEEYPQAGCSVNSNIVEEDKELLKSIDKQKVKIENTEEGVFINIKQEHDDKIYEIPIKKEKLEEHELLDNNGDTDAHYDSLLVPREIQKILDARKLKKPGNNKKKERPQRYREQNRVKLQQREAEIRKPIRYLQSIAVSSTTSNINRLEFKNEEIMAAGSQRVVLEGTQTSFVQSNEQAKEKNALQKLRVRQQRFREQNREKLKQREAERRRRLKMNNEEIIAGISQSSSGLERTQTPSIQRNDQAEEKNALKKKRDRQHRYRVQNREKLKQREAERRQRIGYNNEEKIAATSPNPSGLDGTQTPSIQRNERAKEKNALQRKREYQKRYREQNREKLKQREAERRQRLGFNNEEKIAAISPSSSGLDGTLTPSIERDEQAKVKNALQKKRERQQRYREQNREKLKQREAERRHRIGLNNEKKIADISPSSSGLDGTQTPSIQRNKRAKEKIDLQKKKEYQQRYREQNREKLKQREAERRRRLKNVEIITDYLPFQI